MLGSAFNYENYGKKETYRVRSEAHGRGTFYYTDCGNRMYSIKDEMAYHGCLCPKCGKTLYIRGSEEADEIFKRILIAGIDIMKGETDVRNNQET